MPTDAILLLAAFMAVVTLLAVPLGALLAAVGEMRPVPGLRWLAPLERLCYRVAGVKPERGMGWKSYAFALLLFSGLGTLFVYAVQRLQGLLPFNPQHLGAVSPDSAFNTAVSFVGNTNWQGYAGEQTMSYFSQMVALASQNFLSAATGIAVVFALVRGLAARSSASVGNFWADLVRVTVYVLLPLSLVFAVFLCSQGVIQNFDAYLQVPLLDPAAGAPTQTIAMGPVASQEAIKMLGTNGGGFFNANSAHPYENPNALTNFLQMVAIFLIPAGLCFAFGRMVGDRRQGWTVFAAMAILFVTMALALMWAEGQAHPALQALGVDQAAGALQAGGNMEGKETRFGIAASSLFAAVTTAASCGAVNTMHDSLMPLGGLVPMALMMFGEVVFGGAGSGLYGMLVFAVLGVFIAGLMIGRTPEYLGKKIQSHDMKMVSIAILVTPLVVLLGTALAVSSGAGTAGIANPGAHGFSEMLYAVTSAANNNGSAFAGLSANTSFWNALLGVAIWLGRFAMIVPVLALAGSLAAKPRLATTGGTMPTHGPLFVALLIGAVLLVGVLNYVPALALGPVAEHLQLFSVK
ncbi:potassium-transporting ATPase subunit KdpA [Massilia norwichensis]|uniref:Potassium-transporting ATPase potassium-binding subunit n=1 Tax=Massilia norwichensis TaxID=1442366 RepID=A0ABT2A3V3_9BURK|nr:potassium-transporting ATPase subunit KdpA [Massilia norwichensis]MCS0588878.1 potassium-transporting ATPase subunit KdpA [Massilia norwichensis]